MQPFANSPGAMDRRGPEVVAGPAAPGGKAYTLRYERRPWTLNIERQNNRWKRAALVAEWRQAFGWLAAEARIPPLAAVHITARPHLRNRAAMPDTAACVGAAKAAIDGLVDAGVLTDDGPHIVRRLTFEAPVVTGTDALELDVQGVAA